MITSEEGVELAMHGDTVIEVSVLLRNQLDVKINRMRPMVQLHTTFDDFREFQKVMKIKVLEDLHQVTLEDMILLHASGLAKLYTAEF